ncbi:MAG: hypothetical protein FWG82_00535 [Oscillospiraceae bacterium]|nr:hypothetical protein [Oscillospiraceae bacterium]
MKKPLLNKQTPSCLYCRLAKLAPDGKSLLCPKRGITNGAMSCRSFKYDPLRRLPVEEPVLPKFDFEDFRI